MKFKIEFSKAAIVFIVILFIASAIIAWSQDAAYDRIIPIWSADASVITVTASETLTLCPYWVKCNIAIEQAEGVTEKFRVAVGTTTVSLDLPLRNSFSISVNGPILLAIRTSTDTAKLVMTQARTE